MDFQEEAFNNIIGEVGPMLVEHWKELANHKDIRHLDVDYSMYIKLNEAGLLRVFTVRDEGKLIGYSSFMVGAHLHYKTWLYANCDVYYLKPEYRKTGLSYSFFTEIENWLKSIGIKSVTIQDKVNHSHEKFFLSGGYNAIEQVYEKVF